MRQATAYSADHHIDGLAAVNWGLIPEIFFDFIARLAPGVLLILAAVLVYCGTAVVP